MIPNAPVCYDNRVTKAAKAGWGAVVGVLLCAAALRVTGIQWGLPNTMNADEPHLVNLAVSFGAGTLRPYALKYPTLWPYALFLAFGVYFLWWSRLGLRHGVSQFAAHFAWNPGPFYLIARLLAAAASLVALVVIWREEREYDGASVPWATWMLAVSPVVVELAHSAKPDCLLLLFACLGWAWALRLLRTGARRAHWAAGFAFGLATACQFTAVPAFAAVICAHFASAKKPPFRWLLEAVAAAALGLFVGAPYVYIDFPRVLAGMRDMQALMALKPYSFRVMAPLVLSNAWNYAGKGSVGGLAAVIGFIALLRRDKARAFVLAATPLIYIALLSRHHDGGWARYMLAAFPGLALLGAAGLELVRSTWRWTTPILLIAALAPGVLADYQMDEQMRLPDTRAQAADWIRTHVSQGDTVLLDEPHASPDLVMTKEEVEELAARTRAAGSPRARLYAAMAATHPGGGYRILRIQESAAALSAGPEHVAQSQADQPELDVRPGLDAARAQRVDYVVTSSLGADPGREPDLARFFDELEKRGAMLASFGPEPGRSQGPFLKIYALKAPTSRRP